MAIKMVREPSETPNIKNIDDIIGLRYAYGNQNGYVAGRGNEVDYEVSGSQFKIKSGRLVLQGVESDIDSNGVIINVNNIANKEYYTVYYEVNLGTNTTSIKSIIDTATYPVIDKGDDLTQISSGIARLELYHFTVQNSLISDIRKVVNKIGYYALKTLELSKDEKGRLRLGEMIIPQRKLLSKTSVVTGIEGVVLLNKDVENKTLEIKINNMFFKFYTSLPNGVSNTARYFYNYKNAIDEMQYLLLSTKKRSGNEITLELSITNLNDKIFTGIELDVEIYEIIE